MNETLTDVQRSVLKTLQRFEMAVLFDEVLSEEDVQGALEDLEQAGLVKYVEAESIYSSGYISID